MEEVKIITWLYQLRILRSINDSNNEFLAAIASSLTKGASKTRETRSKPKIRHTRGAQYGLGCGGASQAVTWIPVSVSEIHLDMSLEQPDTQNQPRMAVRVTDGEIMYILWLLMIFIL